MTPIKALHHQADSRPDQVAFVFGGEIWTYARLAAETEHLSCALLAHGVRQGDRVALHMTNLPELVTAYYACMQIGAIAAPLNTRFKTAELRSLLKRLRPVLYLGEAKLYPQVAPIEPEILGRHVRYIVGDAIHDDGAQPWAHLFHVPIQRLPLNDPDIGAPALLLTTSGTTGQPKFVTDTPATLAAKTNALLPLLEDGDIAINAVPMVHAAGLFTTFMFVRQGVPMVLLDRFDAGAVLEAIEAYRCSWMTGLPFMFAEMTRRQRETNCDIGSLRFCLVGGDVCPMTLQHEFENVFGVPLSNFCGATETAGSLIHGLKVGPVSRIAPGAEVRLVDETGAPTPRGEVGELQVRGPHVTIGYWDGPGKINDLRSHGWFATGDLMRQGEGDELWFVARKKDLIIRGGSNISPAEVEHVLMTHPAVGNAVVVGVPDAVLGQRVAGLVELAERAHDPAIIPEILAYAKAQLADYKAPERLEIVAEIPRNALGKIDRLSSLAMLTEDAVAEMA
jgi:acyl-CoA synthetase (AMP-forming)/AMP-acid ligase II